MQYNTVRYNANAVNDNAPGQPACTYVLETHPPPTMQMTGCLNVCCLPHFVMMTARLGLGFRKALCLMLVFCVGLVCAGYPKVPRMSPRIEGREWLYVMQREAVVRPDTLTPFFFAILVHLYG